MLRIIVLTAFCSVFVACGPAFADDDEFLASLRMRGGYDTNPQFTNGTAIGSAFIGTDVALAAAGKSDDATWGVAVEAGGTRYANPLLVPTLTGKVVLRGTMGDDDLRISSTSTIADVNSYNLRSTDLLQEIRVETIQNKIKWFVTAEGGRSTLNQTNAIYQDFLPIPLQFWRGGIIPGVSVITGKGEVGVSVNLSARRYDQELDLFGYRRDNERVQPFVFAKYDSDELSVFASVSQFYGFWHDVDFSNVNRTMFDGSLTWRPKPFTLDVTATRRAGETSFPISPITIDTIYSAKLGWQVDPKWTLTAAAGYTSSEYLDSPYRSEIYTIGVGFTHDVGQNLKWGVDLGHTSGTLLNGERAQGMIVSSSLTRTFAPGTTKNKTDDAAKPTK